MVKSTIEERFIKRWQEEYRPELQQIHQTLAKAGYVVTYSALVAFVAAWSTSAEAYPV